MTSRPACLGLRRLPVIQDLVFFYFVFILFIYFRPCWVFLAVRAFPLLQRVGCRVWASLRWLLWLWSTGSRAPGLRSCSTWSHSCGSWALEHRLRSCGAGA